MSKHEFTCQSSERGGLSEYEQTYLALLNHNKSFWAGGDGIRLKPIRRTRIVLKRDA
jgi:hypothetical protein